MKKIFIISILCFVVKIINASEFYHCTSQNPDRALEIDLKILENNFPKDAEFDFSALLLEKEMEKNQLMAKLHAIQNDIIMNIQNIKDKELLLNSQKAWNLFATQEENFLKNTSEANNNFSKYSFAEVQIYLIQERVCELERYFDIVSSNPRQLAEPQAPNLSRINETLHYSELTLLSLTNQAQASENIPSNIAGSDKNFVASMLMSELAWQKFRDAEIEWSMSGAVLNADPDKTYDYLKNWMLMRYEYLSKMFSRTK